ncbi:Oleate-activated transcription factor 1 [Nakaseomyces bracarensis]|uniref:Oleate-activated transcription factor 1 n=1 Tax=Nakaseomyces bracarensis TaxID=273131 RepID=A0ABR4NM47_9SACH
MPVSSMNDHSPETAEAERIRKRNRISFVCQACRRSKTRCDREKPECTRCKKLNIKCVYDVSKQSAPRIPSKDATISRLEKDVEYWKNKAMKLMQETEGNEKMSKYDFEGEVHSDSSSDREESEDYGPAMKRVKLEQDGGSDYGVNHQDNLEVNLYRTHPTLIVSRVMKREVKPLSENYLFIQDKFLTSLIASIFLDPSKNTMIPALTANANVTRAQPSVRTHALKLKEVLLRQCHTESQRIRVNEFTERILQNANTSKNLKNGMILSMLYNTLGHQFLEDHCQTNGEYSDVLKTFINEIETLLPPYEIIQIYKRHFYQYVYPALPFLEKEMFEESLSEILFKNPDNPDKIKLELGNKHLRMKIENLSILLVILKLSFISLNFAEDNVQHSSQDVDKSVIDRYPISNDFVLLAQKCLASENWCACANENIIACVLYVWAFFVFSPEEGDLFLEHPTDVISSLVMMLATSIGLHRDPSDFPQLRSSIPDIRTLNHRRILWLSVVTVCSFESSLKGRHSVSSVSLMALFLDIKSENADDIYMNRVKADLTDSPSAEGVLKLHMHCLRRVKLVLLLSDLDVMTMTYRGSFRLSNLEILRVKIEDYTNKYFSIKDLNTNIDATTSRTILLAMNSTALHTQIVGRLLLLRASMALFLHFESECLEDTSKLAYYFKYFQTSCIDALSLMGYMNKFFRGDYSASLSSSTNYNVTKVIQLSFSSTIFSVLGILMRVGFATHSLYSQSQDMINENRQEELSEINTKMEILGVLQRDLEVALYTTYKSASEHLRFTYFPIFKLLALFDVVVENMRKGELLLGIFKVSRMEKIHSKIVKMLNLTLGVKLDKRNALVSDLKANNHMAIFSISELNSLSQTVHSLMKNIDEGTFKEDATLSSEFTQGGLNSLNGKIWNPSMDNLAKLSTAMAFSQNMDFHETSKNGTSNAITPQAFSPYPDKVGIAEGKTVAGSTSSETDSNKEGLASDYAGFFGGLDLFDYDFLFGNEFT